MDPKRFDRMTHALAEGRSRRSLVKGLTGGLLAGAASLIVGRGALADHKPDHCAQEGQQAHLDQHHSKSCCPGLVPDANGWCQAPVGCLDAVLAGADGPTATFLLDDDLDVYVNDDLVFSDDDDSATFTMPPIVLGSLANGDIVRLVASDTETEGFCGQFEHLAPVTLYCLSSGTSQVLVADAIETGQNGQPCGHVFYDAEFTVAL
jgi:hypothetical protein